jgi:hypothetical protein
MQDWDQSLNRESNMDEIFEANTTWWNVQNEEKHRLSQQIAK